MVTGTQIALQFPETSPPPLISVEEVHVVRNELPVTSPTPQASVEAPKNLQDLFGAIVTTKQLRPGQLAMLRSTVAHLCRFWGLPPDKIELGALADSLQRFRDYLLDRRFKRNSIRTYMNSSASEGKASRVE